MEKKQTKGRAAAKTKTATKANIAQSTTANSNDNSKRRKRRTAEEILREEASKHVFHGADPNSSAENVAMALSLYINGSAPAPFDPNPKPQAGAIIARTSRHMHATDSQKQQKSLTWKETENNAINKNAASSKATANNGTTKARRSIATNPRWMEFPKVVEDVIENALVGMRKRNEEELKRCKGVKAGIMDVLINNVTASTAVKKHSAGGLSTFQHYCREVKIFLNRLMDADVIDEHFLRKFAKNKQHLRLNEFQAELIKEKANNTIMTKARVSQKRSISNFDKEPSSSSKKPRQKIQQQTAPVQNHKVVSNNNRTMSNILANNERTFVPTNNPMNMSLLGEQRVNKQELLTANPHQRTHLRGTRRQINEIISSFMATKYQGDVHVLCNVLTEYNLASNRLRRMLVQANLPGGVVDSANNILRRFFDMDNIDVLDEEE